MSALFWQRIPEKVLEAKRETAPQQSESEFGKHCADDWGMCHCKGEVRYGYNDRWNERPCDGDIRCSRYTFGDPAPSYNQKHCECKEIHHDPVPVYKTGFAGCYEMLIIGTSTRDSARASARRSPSLQIGWQRQNSVPNNELSAPFCALRCKDQGFTYYSLECPRHDGVECMCAHEVSSSKARDARCEIYNAAGPARCKGPFTQYFAGERYALGAGNYIAAYKVDSPWLRSWLNEQKLLVSQSSKPTVFVMIMMLVYQIF